MNQWTITLQRKARSVGYLKKYGYFRPTMLRASRFALSAKTKVRQLSQVTLTSKFHGVLRASCPTFRTSYPSRIIPSFVARRFTGYVGSKPPNNKIPPPEMWIAVLENTANAPWLFYLPNEDVDKLKRAFTLIFQIILYLGRPQELEKAHQFLAAFATAIVPPDSEIGRARRAIANITRAVVNNMSSVPENSPIRKGHAEIFDILGALRPLHDVYMENVRVGEDLEAKTWSDFWSRAEPMLISLGEALDKKGLGLEQDERKAAGQDESR